MSAQRHPPPATKMATSRWRAATPAVTAAVDVASVEMIGLDVAHLTAMIGHHAMEETTGSPRADATVGQYPVMTIDGVQDPAAAEDRESIETATSTATATVDTDLPEDMMDVAAAPRAHVHVVP